jgi:hypothetical protein
MVFSSLKERMVAEMKKTKLLVAVIAATVCLTSLQVMGGTSSGVGGGADQVVERHQLQVVFFIT